MCTRKAAIAILSAIAILIVPQEVRAQTLLEHVRGWFTNERHEEPNQIAVFPYNKMAPLIEITELSLLEPVEIRIPRIQPQQPVVNPTVFNLQQSSDSHDWTTVNNWLLSGLPEGVPDIDPSIDLDNLSVDRDQFLCLATNIYFEARGSTINDQRAVALVTLNRTRHWRWSGAICDVVWESYQFSWTITANQSRNRVRTAGSWQTSQLVAYEVLRGYVPDITEGSTNYYNPSVVRPAWAGMAVQSNHIGAHRYVVLRTTRNYDPPSNGGSVGQRRYANAIRSIIRQMGLG